MSATFRAFRQFNDPQLSPMTGLRKRLDRRALPYLVPPRARTALVDKLVTELAERGALPIKELFESFEFFERVRRRLRAPVVVDLCCGHGLTGLLFAVFSRVVERVVLVDRRCPDSHRRVHAAALAVAPWIAGRVEYLEISLSRAAQRLPDDCSFVAIHACGGRTDRCIEMAMARRAKLAVMPCCYSGTAATAPPALRDALGSDLSSDINRTYWLHQAGYRVEWSEIPRPITEKNRIIVATPA